MPRLVPFVLLGALVVLAAAPSGRTSAAPVPKHLMPKDPPAALPLTVGTTWVYETSNGQDATVAIAKVERKDGEHLVTTEWVRAEGKRTHHMTLAVSDRGVFLVAEGGRNCAAPWCIWKLPHKEGEVWKTGHGADMRTGPVEKVKVPYGEITAQRVDWGTVKYWYAPGTGLVRMDGNPTWKLKAFRRADG